MKLFYGLILILFGVYVFYYTYKNPNKGDDYDCNAPDFKGYGSGLGLIVVGIILIKKWCDMN
jgi:hypothetical protein